MSENGIIRQEKENTKEKIELIVRTTMNLQNTLMNQSMNNEWDFERIIKSMKKDIEAYFGSSLSLEIDTAIS